MTKLVSLSAMISLLTSTSLYADLIHVRDKIQINEVFSIKANDDGQISIQNETNGKTLTLTKDGQIAQLPYSLRFQDWKKFPIVMEFTRSVMKIYYKASTISTGMDGFQIRAPYCLTINEEGKASVTKNAHRISKHDALIFNSSFEISTGLGKDTYQFFDSGKSQGSDDIVKIFTHPKYRHPDSNDLKDEDFEGPLSSDGLTELEEAWNTKRIIQLADEMEKMMRDPKTSSILRLTLEGPAAQSIMEVAAEEREKLSGESTHENYAGSTFKPAVTFLEDESDEDSSSDDESTKILRAIYQDLLDTQAKDDEEEKSKKKPVKNIVGFSPLHGWVNQPLKDFKKDRKDQ